VPSLQQYDEDEPFNPDFVQIERVLAWSQERVQKELPLPTAAVVAPSTEKTTTECEAKDDDSENESDNSDADYELVTHYLVKWRALAYEECTWELETAVDKDKIAQFHQRQLVTPARLKETARPSEKDWRPLEEHPTFKDGNKLRDYQLEGLNYLTYCYHKRLVLRICIENPH